MLQKSAALVTRRWTPSEANAVFLLENGSTMDQKTFHALYLKTPEGFKAELIGGVVYVMSSPVSLRHGKHHSRLMRWLCTYTDDTVGTEVGDNTTNVLGEESEPQPDAFLIIEPEWGGQTTIDKKEMVHGAPELVAEVAVTSAAIDLKAKKADYERAGVKEYIVVLVESETIRWFVRTGGGFAEHLPDSDGIIRSIVFPGLWLEPHAFFERPTRRLFHILDSGLASPEHAAFVAELKVRRKKGKPAAKKPRRKTK